MAVMTRQRGIFCPRCLKIGQHPYCWRRPAPGIKVRYYKCHACGFGFRSKERVETGR